MSLASSSVRSSKLACEGTAFKSLLASSIESRTCNVCHPPATRRLLYRDEVYNPETERRNQADIIVAKHRNRPVGEVVLYFIGLFFGCSKRSDKLILSGGHPDILPFPYAPRSPSRKHGVVCVYLTERSCITGMNSRMPRTRCASFIFRCSFFLENLLCMADRVGQQLGHYRLLRVLGEGSFATVYLGEHQYLERLAAIKVLHVRMEASTHESFRREARTIAQLRHPHIIGVHDFGFEENTPYLVMEYTPNGTLRSQFAKGTRLPFEQIVAAVSQVASALDYAHEQHVIHRDVKPENILLRTNDEVMLSDFGLAVVQSTLGSDSMQSPAGTPIYMAPEQIQHKPCAASDQYALGVMVYEWLCGEPPFHGSLFEVFAQHLHKPPPSLRARVPDLAPAVEDAVFGALAKDPGQRFGSVTDFAQVLAEAFFATQPLQLRGDSPDQASLLLTHSTSSPAASSSEQDHSDGATQPRLKAVQRIDRSPELGASVSPRSTIHRQLGTSQSLSAQEPTPAPAGHNQNRVRMLRRLRRAYSEIMSQSLQGTAWLELEIASTPDAVQNAAHLLLHMERSTEELLPAGTSITQAYDEAEHELLILGEPGAGKSTLLLNLAEQLLLRTEHDETHPLPVILPLSTWAVKRPKLEDWIAEQLTQIYDVPRKLSGEWVQQGHILPLLDGLDEMEETARASCIAAINTYHRDHMAPLVVCSRTTEYEAVTSHSRLTLQGAVVVQPLTHSDVDAYLERAGQPLTALRSALEQNTALHDLATTPLMLNILIITYQGTSVRDLPDIEAALQKLVWDDYTERMVMRKGSSHRYPLGETRAWLGWLARQMRDHNQAVFYLEHLQPDWLTARQQRTYAWLAVHLPAIIIGVLISILVYVFFLGDTNPSSLLKNGVLGGLLGGLWHGSDAGAKEEGREHRHTWEERLLKRLTISACIGLIYGLGFGLDPSPFKRWQIDGPTYGIMIGLSSLLLQYLLTRPFHSGISSKASATRWWERVVRFGSLVQGPRALLVAVIVALSDGLRIWLGFALWNDSVFRMIDVLSYGLSVGLSYALISLTLSAQMANIHLTERLKWTWKNLLRGLFNSRHLRVTGLLTCISMVFLGLGVGLTDGLDAGLSYVTNGLNIGLSYWLLLGLYQGMAKVGIEDRDRRRPNQGIHRSLRNSVIMGIIGGGIIGIIGELSGVLNIVLSYLLSVLKYGTDSAQLWLSDWQLELVQQLDGGGYVGQYYPLNFMLSHGSQIGIGGALLICMIVGGLAVWRHSVIRFLLRRSHTFPMLAPQFLDDAVARFLLRRVGGGYSFVHRLLLDHLADATAYSKRPLR